MEAVIKQPSKRRVVQPKGDLSDGISEIKSDFKSFDSDFSTKSGSKKRAKMGSPKNRNSKNNHDESDVLGLTDGDEVNVSGTFINMRRKKKKNVAEERKAAEVNPATSILKLKNVTEELVELVLADGVDSSMARAVMRCSAKYESMIMSLLLENEKLKEKVANECLRNIGGGVVAEVPLRQVQVSSGSTSVKPVVKKPVETWSVVVKGKGEASSKEIVDKVVKEVGPTLGVRVHDLKPIRSGGAVLRTPSVAEREKVAANKKFEEVGLQVSIKDKLGPKIVVQRVHAEISPDEFMSELYEMNLKDLMSLNQFKKSVRMVSVPWKNAEGSINVVLEGDSEAMELLLDNGRIYIKWFSFVVRLHDIVSCCYRCLGFDHVIRDCRSKDGVCRRCSKTGHVASKCGNSVWCRNCSFKGLPAEHLMLSMACPLYAAMVARANARH